MSENQRSTKSKRKKKRRTSKSSGCGIQVEGCADTLATVDAPVLNASVTCERRPLHTSMELLQVATKCSNASAVASRKAAGSNWESQLGGKSGTPVKEVVEKSVDTNGPDVENTTGTTLSKAARVRQKRKAAQLNKYVAMDCEMVGVGLNGQEDMLARVSVVNKRGEVLLDKFVKARDAVTDYRTSVSGIRPHDIDNGEDFKVVQEEVIQLVQGKILVGHAIRNDLAVLHIKHPYANIRDTARYKPLCRLVANGRTPSLKRLSQAILGLEIQTGEHNSVEDARAAMKIYNRLSSDWEHYLKKHQHKKL